MRFSNDSSAVDGTIQFPKLFDDTIDPGIDIGSLGDVEFKCRERGFEGREVI
jgi:hypothetical protein